MKPESKIKVLAELDGWIFYPSKDNGFGQARPEFWQNEDTGEQVWENHPKFKPYLTSYDAIIPLVVKWCGTDFERATKFEIELEDCVTESKAKKSGSSTVYTRMADLIGAEPEQMADALIHATGKWQEE